MIGFSLNCRASILYSIPFTVKIEFLKQNSVFLSEATEKSLHNDINRFLCIESILKICLKLIIC